MSDEDEPEYSLVMPFVAVASKGGPFDDQAYVAGYEMGSLDTLLGDLYTHSPTYRTIREANREQADLIAMRHGWTATWYPHDDGWVGVEFSRVPEARR